MLAQDIVDKLSASIPLHTSGFSTSLSVTSIVPTGNIALATTATPHGIVNGQNVTITGALTPVDIDTSAFARVLTTATFKTLQDHDLTLSDRDRAAGGKTLTISGATESEFNGTFSIIQVVNRRKLIISVPDSGSTTISGSPIVENANAKIFNGLVTAANVTASTFEYTLPASYPIPAAGTIIVQTEIRILSVIDIGQFLSEVYTKQIAGEDMLVVQLGDVTQSQNRNERTDAADSTSGEYSFNPILIQPFGIYIVQNATDFLSGSPLRDKVESEYIPAIFKSVLRAQFDTGFTYGLSNRATFTGHGVFSFRDEENGKNRAVYVHELTFQQIATLDKIADTVGPNANVAMRNVDYTITTDLGTGELLANVDLDDEPIT